MATNFKLEKILVITDKLTYRLNGFPKVLLTGLWNETWSSDSNVAS